MLAPNLERGQTYEHTYGGWLDFFRAVAVAPSGFKVAGVPRCWVPFLYYLGADIDWRTVAPHFVEDNLCSSISELASLVRYAENEGRLRELVEFYSALRPELVDALYKSDVLWPTAGRRHQTQREFNVTCNGSFFRPEVLAFIERVREYEPEPRVLTVIVPCAADKPYPAPLHKVVKAALPMARLVVATGVLGVIPEELFDEAPQYDSGIPNIDRVATEVSHFFGRNEDALGFVINYSDFYGEAVEVGLHSADIEAPWPIRMPVFNTIEDAHRRAFAAPEYIDLMSDMNIARLKRVAGEMGLL